MTRPKVDPEKRQRTANACDSCKRRKQKVCERTRDAIPIASSGPYLQLAQFLLAHQKADLCCCFSLSVTAINPAAHAPKSNSPVHTPQNKISMVIPHLLSRLQSGCGAMVARIARLVLHLGVTRLLMAPMV